MEIASHSAIEMTMNIYGHVNLDTQRAALDHLDEQLTRISAQGVRRNLLRPTEPC